MILRLFRQFSCMISCRGVCPSGFPTPASWGRSGSTSAGCKGKAGKVLRLAAGAGTGIGAGKEKVGLTFVGSSWGFLLPALLAGGDGFSTFQPGSPASTVSAPGFSSCGSRFSYRSVPELIKTYRLFLEVFSPVIFLALAHSDALGQAAEEHDDPQERQ